MRIVYHTFGNVACTIIIILLHGNREYGYRFFKHVTTTNDFVNEDSKTLTDQLLKRRTKYFFIAAIIMIIANMVLPVLSVYFLHAKVGSINTLLFPSYYPWIMSPGNYVFTMVYQTVVFLTIFSVYGAAVLFTSSAATIIYAHCTILKKHITSLICMHDSPVELQFHSIDEKNSAVIVPVQKDNSKEILEKMRFIIRYHQFFTKYATFRESLGGEAITK